MSHHEHHHEDHDHEHVHDVAEVLEAAQDPSERRKILATGIGNGILAAIGTWATFKIGARPTLAEAIHNVSDVSFYLTPWYVTLRNNIRSKRALACMRGSSYIVASIAATDMVYEAYTVVTDTYETTAGISIPVQAGLTAGNILFAAYLTLKPSKKGQPDTEDKKQSIMKSVADRHAIYDARTSALALGSNIAAQALPIAGPLGAIYINRLTIKGERENITQVNEVEPID